MVSASGNEITACSSTFVNKAIFFLAPADISTSDRQINTSGCKPIERNSLTEC